MKTRRRKALVLLGATLGVLVSAMGGYRMWRMHQATLPILPEYTEPGRGPRSPESEALGFSVGKTTIAQLERTLRGRSLECVDASASLLARRMREAKLHELDRTGAEQIDGVSRASLSRPSRYERDPQVRWSCEHATVSSLGQPGRVEGEGRLLAVFDSPSTPLRSISYQRTLADHHAALAELTSAVARYTHAYGAPTRTLGAMADAREGAFEFARYVPAGAEWKFSDLEIRVVGTFFGARGISIDETAQVPWPVRPDAPADPRPVRVARR